MIIAICHVLKRDVQFPSVDHRGNDRHWIRNAQEFLDEGARVIITGANPKNLEAAGQKLGAFAVLADAGSVAAQDTVAEAVKKEFGELDVLFCNAGRGVRKVSFTPNGAAS
jgi:NAD(P)-dependent dehydrogenase (short-subunit alcohol dehydrogenase family)